MREDEIVEKISEEFGELSPRVLVGIGDDGAVLRENVGKDLVISTDSLVENIHFTFSLLRPPEVGYRGMVAALSDIAAMGGHPLASLVNVQSPPEDIGKIFEIYEGFKPILKEYCIDLIGGNISRGKEFSITFTVIGEVSRGKAWTRRGAKDGDVIFITGDIGRVKAFFMLEKLHAKGYEWWFRETRAKFASPEVRLKEVERLKNENISVNSCIDISDGLSLELWRLAKSSEVSIVLYTDRIPIRDSVRYIAENLNINPLDIALSSGEEYELVFTVPKEESDKVENLKFIRIGEVRSGEIGVFSEDGKRLEPMGWQHFK